MAKKKFALLGLDNAGKTSILTAFRRKYHYEDSVRELTPTISVSYSKYRFLNHEISLWDYGGQIKYREKYMVFAEYYLADIDLLFYVIDVQDPERFDESLDYLTNLFEYLMGINHLVPVIICFHKADPGKFDPEYLDIVIEDWEGVLAERFPGWYFVVAETSIYNAESIVRAMSFSLSLFIPAVEEVGGLLRAFRRKVDAYAVLLLTISGEVLGEAYTDPFDPDEQTALYNVIRETLAPFHGSKKLREENVGKVVKVSPFNDFERRGLFLNGKFYLTVLFPAEKEGAFEEQFPDLSTKVTQLLEEF
ncbi:MAG: ADP-ribosylation factor-like protein [Promethearchaeota archaeon]